MPGIRLSLRNSDRWHARGRNGQFVPRTCYISVGHGTGADDTCALAIESVQHGPRAPIELEGPRADVRALLDRLIQIIDENPSFS
jgi:hypothetical protein